MRCREGDDRYIETERTPVRQHTLNGTDMLAMLLDQGTSLKKILVTGQGSGLRVYGLFQSLPAKGNMELKIARRRSPQVLIIIAAVIITCTLMLFMAVT